MVLIAVLGVLLAGWLALVALDLAAAAGAGARDRATERSLARAREALLAYAADRPIDADVGPGYLPCPDLDNDGWAESTCGSLAGDVGQRERLGRLPWKTLGLEDLRDGHGERLWYAVSTKHKGLLNCAPTPACVDMTADAALGTISVREPSGAWRHDGRIADALHAARGGAAAVVLAPGAALTRRDGHHQHRDCGLPDCDALGRCLPEPRWLAAACDPRNYLDVATLGDGPREDNARFVDRIAPRDGNGDGFVTGAGAGEGGTMNDRLVAVGHADLTPRVAARIAAEAAHCLRAFAADPRAHGRLPWAAPSCAASPGGVAGTGFGRLPTPPFVAAATPQGPLPTSWTAHCAIGDGTGWWTAWRRAVFYAVAPGHQPSSPLPSCTAGACLAVRDAEGRTMASDRRFAVMVAGPPLATAAGRQDRSRPEPAHWLEGAHVPEEPCEVRAPGAVTTAPRSAAFNDAVVASP